MLQRRHSSLLEIEATDYFKLDEAQVHMFKLSSHNNQPQAKRGNHSDMLAQQSNYKSNQAATRAKLEPSLQNIRHNKPVPVNKCQLISEKNGTCFQTNVPESIAKHEKRSESSWEPEIFASSDFLAASSTISTNSLPSISSSPSVSPSLMCPHLSLDDILGLRSGSKSPHTIGLCRRCRLDPPPDVHSPLSPAFKPSHLKLESTNNGALKRGYSDHQATSQSARARIGLGERDDSLDYCLEPKELKRMQLSPNLRHSVGFIRKNSIEAGRVLTIHKNGLPFDRPLRICVTHGEFATLNHLLDHINSRQLIPLGARYLFHIDGQLVYSINELKHNSIYIVSGTRNFDFRANNLLKKQYKRQSKTSRVPNDQRAIQSNITVAASFAPIDQTKAALGSKSQEEGKSKQSRVSRDAKLDGERERTFGEEPAGANREPINTTKRLICESKSIHQEREKRKHQENFQNEPRKPETVSLNNSNENLESREEVGEQPVSVVRAKSELSALPNKRKKNVTFMDTGRGSSPAIDIAHENKPKETCNLSQNGEHNVETNPKTNILETNEIGIQVSDSIEGFLIDLPLPLPAQAKAEARRGPVRGKLSSQTGGRFQRRQKQAVAGKVAPRGVRTREASKQSGQVVTITERQLSLEEMDKLKDLDHGDHHSEAHRMQPIVIKLDAADEISNSDDNRPDELADETGETTFDRENTISIGQELDKTEEKSADLIDEEPNWQYPGGREGSTTPSERPVSQSNANESVHARVTTPTPSLSTAGETNSLALSCEPAASPTKAELPPKERRPVTGKLRGGIEPPDSNFRLVWVNGFIINDKFPDNSVSLSQTVQTTSPAGERSSLLSPSDGQLSVPSNFKPNDRFPNWICHSALHDELIYPAGSLVVLWCKRTNEQRYYSQHTSSVSAIGLASLDTDLALSAQVGDASERTPARLHLWSLGSLDTLRIVDDDHFVGRRIFSLKARNTKSEGCELTVGAKDDKRLWLYVFLLRVGAESNQLEQMVDSPKKQTKSKPASGRLLTVMKVNKLLQANQMPLLVTRLTNVRAPELDDSSGQQKQQLRQQLDDLLLSFGRRHFQIWSADRKQQKMRLLQAESKSAAFGEMVVKANSLVRMSPNELLGGDSDGNVMLLLLTRSIKAKMSPKSLLGNETSDQKYTIECVKLIKPLGSSQDKPDAGPYSAPITCLARVTGSIFMSSDSKCTLKFWKIERQKQPALSDAVVGREEENIDSSGIYFNCRHLASVSLPTDLGFVSTIVLSKYSRKQALVEFYVVSTSNAILFGAVQLKADSDGTNSLVNSQSSLTIVYEGHETSATGLVADSVPLETVKRPLTQSRSEYFTCSIDCKICKWNGTNLVWKSMLPSACAALAVHPTGFVLAVGSADGTVYILDKLSGLLISYFPLTPVCINCLAYSRDGTLLAAGCANGSIFILPVYERGLKYKKVSIFQSPHPVVSLQFSTHNKYILTSVTHGSYQELILWDLPNFRYMRDNVKTAADKIEWFDSICSGSEDVRAIWENANLLDDWQNPSLRPRAISKRKAPINDLSGTVVNLSCHRMVLPERENLVVASDTRGYLRLFRYPCYNIEQGFFEARVGSAAVNCCRFLADGTKFVSSSLEGPICLWSLEPDQL